MRRGYVWVENKRVESILKNGYMSVRAQRNKHIVTLKELYEKYGKQFMKAKQMYKNCPKSIVGYLQWRVESSPGKMNGNKAIYYLFRAKDAPKKFREGRTCLRLEWPSVWKTEKIVVPKSRASKGLWLAGIPHALVHAPTGVIKNVSRCTLRTPPPSGTR
jgi:hypothetical protein